LLLLFIDSKIAVCWLAGFPLPKLNP